MQLLLILAVLAALVVCESGPSEPVSDAAGRVALAAGGIALVAVLALLISGLTARRLRADFSGHRTILRRFSRLRRVHTALWLLCIFGVCYGLDWGRLVRINWHLDGVFLADELLILLPVLLPLILSWAAFYEVERALQQRLRGPDMPGERIATRREYVSLHVRHYLGIVLLPLLGFLAVRDAVELVFPEAMRGGHEAWVLLGCLGAILVLFPVLLRHVWETRPLPPGPLRSRLEDTAERAGFRVRDILVWHTNGMVINAAVAGFVRRLRYVFLSDALLLRLGDDEIEAVFGHEMGHVRHHHLLLRVLAMIAPLSLCMLLGQVVPHGVDRLLEWSAGEQLGTGTPGAGALGASIPTGLVLLGLMGGYVLVVFGYYSRQLEHQADLFGCRWVAADPQRPAVERFTSALEKLAAGTCSGRDGRSWQHASIARRIDFLQQLSRDPERELRFQRWVRLLGSLLIGTALSPLAYQLLLG